MQHWCVTPLRNIYFTLIYDKISDKSIPQIKLAMKTETSQQKSLPEWEELLEVAQQNTTAKWISRPGQTPA
ncbi:MAG: hypothetical protein F6K34_11045, partial [Okeania sp. SIO4D6]|nr:hypothetical protein [Okeania sp. SIO4D6]